MTVGNTRFSYERTERGNTCLSYDDRREYTLLVAKRIHISCINRRSAGIHVSRIKNLSPKKFAGKIRTKIFSDKKRRDREFLPCPFLFLHSRGVSGLPFYDMSEKRKIFARGLLLVHTGLAELAEQLFVGRHVVRQSAGDPSGVHVMLQADVLGDDVSAPGAAAHR